MFLTMMSENNINKEDKENKNELTDNALAIKSTDAIKAYEQSKPIDFATEMVNKPSKVIRIGNMIKQLLEEIRVTPLDSLTRNHIQTIYRNSINELKDAISDELLTELNNIVLPFLSDTEPTDAMLRLAHAQLVGWLEGLFHGLQTAILTQKLLDAKATSLSDLSKGIHSDDSGQYL